MAATEPAKDEFETRAYETLEKEFQEVSLFCPPACSNYKDHPRS